jgi:peptide/nickel transport system permease protein
MATATVADIWRRGTSAMVSLRTATRLVRRDPLALIGLGIIGVFVVVALLAPWLAPYPAEGRGQSNLPNRLEPPSLAHPFGTDDFGRDLLSRVMFGAGLALQTGVLTVLLAFPVGVFLGVLAGHFKGLLEEGLMRVTDMFLAFPPILLAFVIAATLGRGTWAIIIAMAVSFWPWYTRLVYAQVVHLRSQPFVEAAVALGLPTRRIVVRHLLPNAITPATIQASIDIGSAILIGSALSYLGLGPPPPTPDWGVMFNNAYLSGSLITFWWFGLFLGLPLFLVVLAFNLVSDAFRDVLDPKMRRRRLL